MDLVLRISIIVITILVGLAAGSFLNVVIYRLPNNMSLAKPASHCPKCQNPIKWYDNIPLLSYIILRGKCRHCHEKISFRYPFVEILNTVLWFTCLILFTNVVIPTMTPNWYKFGVSLLVVSVFIAIFFSDLDTMTIPEVLQLVLLIGGLVLLLEKPDFETILLKVIGFVGAGLLFYFVNLVYKLLHHKDGLGFGDIELVAVGGLLLGAYQVIYALLVACLSCLVVMLILTLLKKRQEKEFAFATFLTFGLTVAIFSGEYVINAYLSLLGVK